MIDAPRLGPPSASSCSTSGPPLRFLPTIKSATASAISDVDEIFTSDQSRRTITSPFVVDEGVLESCVNDVTFGTPLSDVTVITYCTAPPARCATRSSEERRVGKE